MLKKTITYEDFNGETVSEDFYFNMNKAELIELELSEKDGFSISLQRILDSKDNSQVIPMFKHIIKLAYGEKSLDGKKFRKSDEIWEEFVSTAAYAQFFSDICTNANEAVAFVNGIVPADLAAEVAAETAKITANNAAEEATEIAKITTNNDASVAPSEKLKLSTKDLQAMSREELLAAMKAKNQALPE